MHLFEISLSVMCVQSGHITMQLWSVSKYWWGDSFNLQQWAGSSYYSELSLSHSNALKIYIHNIISVIIVLQYIYIQTYIYIARGSISIPSVSVTHMGLISPVFFWFLFSDNLAYVSLSHFKGDSVLRHSDTGARDIHHMSH